MRASSVQLEIRDEPKAATVERALALLDKSKGSDLVLLPELWPTGYFAFDRYAADAETLDGPTVRALREKARALKAWIFGGSLVENEGGKLFNTSIFIDASGQLVARYRKMHLFGYGSEERKALCAGSEPVVADTPWGRAGLATCYDLRFPELFRAMVDRGAQLFLVASAWPAARVEPWRLFNRARALENQSWLISCNCAGTNAGKTLAGNSHIVDPWGEVLARGSEGEEIVTADVDPQRAEAARREFPALADRVLGAATNSCFKGKDRAMLKEHLEFFTVNVKDGFAAPPGYPKDIEQKVLAGRLDEQARTGTRSRLLRFQPGAFTTEPFEHEYWEEVFLVEGDLEVGGEVFEPFTYAVRPPHTPHGPFKSKNGCLLFEIHYFDPADARKGE